MKFWIFYYVTVNILGFANMWIDKRAAERDEWRTPEKSLVLLALGGGTIGILLGMYCFRHKTKKPKFKYGMPAILIVQLALAIWVMTL